MMKLLFCSVILVCSLIPARAQASCTKQADATPESTCVVMKRGEVRGVWYELKRADVLRKAHLEVPELRLQIIDHEIRANTRDWQIGNYREALKLRGKTIEDLKGSMVAFARTAREAKEGEREAIEDLHAWYRSPATWALIGGGVVTAIVVALAVSGVGQ